MIEPPVNPGNWAVSSVGYFSLRYLLIMLYFFCMPPPVVHILLMFGTVGS